MSDSSHRDPMKEFANRIIAELEKGMRPWVRPWDPEKAGGPQAPFNPIPGKRYHGINVLILAMDMLLGFRPDYAAQIDGEPSSPVPGRRTPSHLTLG